MIEHIKHTVELIFEEFNDSFTSDTKQVELNPWHFHFRVFTRMVDANGKIIMEEDMLSPYNENICPIPISGPSRNATRL